MMVQRTLHKMEDVAPESLWLTATPSPTTLSLPFYIMEAGHFLAPSTYSIQREQHDSFLLIYTNKGTGYLHSLDTQFELTPESCIIIDCHTPHSYGSKNVLWDFLWIHFEGNGVRSLFHQLYSSGHRPIQIHESFKFSQQLMELLQLTTRNDILSCIGASSCMHHLFYELLQNSLEHIEETAPSALNSSIRPAIDYIQSHFSESMTIEDMIRDIPISKYHFIRSFRKVMGMTPYHYLTNYRINMAKIRLRSTTDSIAAIAEQCGFPDTSNFISHFKKQTGVRPTQYRKDFSLTSS